MKPSDRSSVPTAIRDVVLAANGGNCTYCTWETAQAIDHVVPVNEGGRDDVSNLVPACASCNSSKRDRGVLRWRRDIRARPEVTIIGMFLGERCYHEPDQVTYLDQEQLIEHVARVQAEVMDNFQQLELLVATRLISDLNRFIARLGNLSPERQRALRSEAQLRLSGHEELNLADPGKRRLMLREADWRQSNLHRQLREPPPAEAGRKGPDAHGSREGIRR